MIEQSAAPKWSVNHVKGRIWQVNFLTPADINEQSHRGIFEILGKASQTGPIIFIGNFPPETRFIDPRLLTMWLEEFSQKKIRIIGVATVTASAAVRGVTNGFSLALRALSKQLFPIAALKTLPEAIAWATDLDAQNPPV
jgi:hypothetical protein